MLYLSFKFVRKFKFCVSPLVKRYPAQQILCLNKNKYNRYFKLSNVQSILHPKTQQHKMWNYCVPNSHSHNILGQSEVHTKNTQETQEDISYNISSSPEDPSCECHDYKQEKYITHFKISSYLKNHLSGQQDQQKFRGRSKVINQMQQTKVDIS